MATKAKILIVDDNVDFSEAVKMTLESGGYEVEVANSVADARERLQQSVPDVIILDILMQKGAEGITFSRQLKKDPTLERVPILMLTSVTKQTGFSFVADDPRHPDFLPVNEFIEKPVPPKVLFERVESLLRQRGTS